MIHKYNAKLRRPLKKYGGSFKLQQKLKLLSKFFLPIVFVTAVVPPVHLPPDGF